MKLSMKKTLVIMGICIICLGLVKYGRELILSKETEQINESLEKEYIVVGFSQLGAESDWRSANTESMKEAFSMENGYKLLFEDGQQKQSNQITAVRTFIQQEVDYIILAPVTETGWDTVLQEAQEAGIPVIVVDRMVDVENGEFFSCWVGSDFELEGKKATEWLLQYTKEKDIKAEDIHIVNIQGTLGASAQIGRSKALRDAAEKNGWDLMEEASGEFTQAKGKEVMEYFLNKYDNINVVYCENDNEAYGAIEAIEAIGKKVGSDITNGEVMVISFDGVKSDAKNYVVNGKISCIAECNPLHGPRVKAVIELLEAGKEPEKFQYVDGEVYTAEEVIQKIVVDDIEYDITILSSEIIENM